MSSEPISSPTILRRVAGNLTLTPSNNRPIDNAARDNVADSHPPSPVTYAAAVNGKTAATAHAPHKPNSFFNRNFPRGPQMSYALPPKKITPIPNASSKKTGIILSCIENTSILDYVYAVGEAIGGGMNITHASKISNDRVAIHFKSEELVNKFMDESGGITLKDQFIEARTMANRVERLIISNVPPEVPDAELIDIIQQAAIVSGPAKHFTIGARKEGYDHILSYRRAIPVIKRPNTVLPDSFLLDIDDSLQRIYMSFEEPRCYKCKLEGHVARFCNFRQPENEPTGIASNSAQQTSEQASNNPEPSSTNEDIIRMQSPEEIPPPPKPSPPSNIEENTESRQPTPNEEEDDSHSLDLIPYTPLPTSPPSPPQVTPQTPLETSQSLITEDTHIYPCPPAPHSMTASQPAAVNREPSPPNHPSLPLVTDLSRSVSCTQLSLDSLCDSDADILTDDVCTNTRKSKRRNSTEDLTVKKKMSKDEKGGKSSTHRLDHADKERINVLLSTDTSTSSLTPESVITFLEDTHNRNTNKQLMLAKCITRDFDVLCEALEKIRPHVTERLKMRIARIINHLSNVDVQSHLES